MLRIIAALFAFGIVLSAQAQVPQAPAGAPAKIAVKKQASAKSRTASRPAAQISPTESGACIGVISLIGERFGVKKVGITVFGNEYHEISAEDFKLDDLVVDRVRAAIGADTVVRKIPYAKGALDSYSPGGGLFSGSGDEKAAALLGQVVGRPRCERYVVVARSRSQFVGNQDVRGVGIINQGGPLVSTSYVHAVLAIVVYDGEAFSVIKRSIGSTSGLNLVVGSSAKWLRGFTWPETPEAADSPVVRDAARALVAEALDKALPDLLAQ